MGILLKCISEAAGNLKFLTTCSYGMFFIAFLHNSCNFHYLILGWSTLVVGPSINHMNSEETDLLRQIVVKFYIQTCNQAVAREILYPNCNTKP